MRSVNERRAAARADRRDSARDAQDRRRDDWNGRRRSGSASDDRRDSTGGRDASGRDGVRGNGRDGYDATTPNGRYPDARGGNAPGYGTGYGAGYGAGDGRYGPYGPYDPRYTPPGRATGTCLDRDGDGWCDDSRAGGGYCLDRDGDARCDDYPELASAPYSSALPPMRAAADVERGYGSEAALRWLGTAEVTVRTTDLRRTGIPTRATWLDANSGRLLQVWTDRNGDGIADRVDIYRGGRIVKTIGR
jgi:hypothetical protein